MATLFLLQPSQPRSCLQSRNWSAMLFWRFLSSTQKLFRFSPSVYLRKSPPKAVVSFRHPVASENRRSTNSRWPPFSMDLVVIPFNKDKMRTAKIGIYVCMCFFQVFKPRVCILTMISVTSTAQNGTDRERKPTNFSSRSIGKLSLRQYMYTRTNHCS